MTDNEIIKALECCKVVGGTCKGCALGGSRVCIGNLHEKALDLIDRKQEMIDGLISGQETLQKALADKQAEIERLRAECWNQSVLWNKHFEGIFETAKETIKAEAIKEFAERLKKDVEMISYEMCSEYQETIDTIDNLVKEMVGEK